MNDDDIEHGLAVMFANVWDAFVEGLGAGGAELEVWVEATGLAAWRPATIEDVTVSNLDLEVGDQILCLTDAGKRVVLAGRA